LIKAHPGEEEMGKATQDIINQTAPVLPEYFFASKSLFLIK
jgi:hypothetical protein